MPKQQLNESRVRVAPKAQKLKGKESEDSSAGIFSLIILRPEESNTG